MMNVKIAYTVDLEEIPSKSKELLSRAGSGLADAVIIIAEAAREANDAQDPVSILKKIEEGRKRMFKADALLEDVSYIIAGYGQAILSQNAPPPTPDTPEGAPPPTPDTPEGTPDED